MASHAEGGATDPASNLAPTTASGASSHAEGIGTTAGGFAAHAEGGTSNVAVAIGPLALGDFSHAEGGADTANSIAAPIADASFSHVEGSGTITTASATYAHAEGQQTQANGASSHVEGFLSVTTVNGNAAHAEGFSSTADSVAAHAEGYSTTSSGFGSHSEGQFTQATIAIAHAEGGHTIANALYSHAEGNGTSTNGQDGAHIMGQYGNADSTYSWHLGNGTPLVAGLAARIDGTLAQGIATHGWVTGTADYAEMFETVDGNPIDVGYFVTIEGKKIRKANSQDVYVLGVTSATPGVLGAAAELEWKDKWQKDKWGRWLFHEVVVPPVMDKQGREIVPGHTDTQKIVNPEYDAAKQYVPRSKRPEWVPVGLLGQLLGHDDGTCEIGGYCKANDDGVATSANTGYRVLDRADSNQVLVLVSSTLQLSLVDQLEQLLKLKEQGVLTDDEFEIAKQRILHS
ncbi:peptidase G2 autoproteolytic cleavage domain-containing protein [Alicyclobacillus sp. ALC3]|uniref:peptidase G2 autoproteolytic cleavage domain-containing protein n=1 Tax=Alicyclobacillus sp. ALC3 TaxID=2796143 RepID=UPI00237800B8|nr:peptidase G2 autoproteolytic cleavage domain-containing protein [Alicyclobacillus sp. ALC3]